MEGVEGNFQLTGGHVGLQHRVILYYSPAAQVTDLVGIKCFSGHGGHSLPGIGAGLGGRHGRQQKTDVYQMHKNDHQSTRIRAHRRRTKEIPQQNAAPGMSVFVLPLVAYSPYRLQHLPCPGYAQLGTDVFNVLGDGGVIRCTVITEHSFVNLFFGKGLPCMEGQQLTDGVLGFCQV